MIGYIAPYTFTQLGTTGNTALSLFCTLSVHLCTRTNSPSSLVVSWQRIYQSHCHFKSHMKSSLHSLIPFLAFLLSHLPPPSPELEPVLFRLLFCTPCYSDSSTSVKVKVKVTLRLTVYHQSVYLGIKPLETHDQNSFFFTPN
jgi:hypothetical protein